MGGQTRVESKTLQAFAAEVFAAVGMPREDAQLEAQVLVWANLRGIDSHGVVLIPDYVDALAAGEMNPRPNIVVESETPATVVLEGDRALGPVVTMQAVDRVAEKASAVGIGWGLIRNTTHQGAMGFYSSQLAERDMLGLAIVCSPPNMAPFGARAAGVHNSPITIAVPGASWGPFVLDLATSVAAGGKVMVARDKGVPIPEGWALDDRGNPTTDPNLATILLPFAGPKGSGLAMMFECMSSLMLANPLLIPVLRGGDPPSMWLQNSVVAAIDIATFGDVETYKKSVDDLIDGLKSLPRAAGNDEIMVPGEPERRTLDERSKEGIPLPTRTVERLSEVAERQELDVPW